MKIAVLLLIALLILIPAGLYVWRLRDYRADQIEVDRLLALGPPAPLTFSKDMVSDLPAPAKRYFLFAIAEGTPLSVAAEISMRGQFGLGNRDAPNYLPMQAQQILAAPEGFIWKMSAGSGAMRVSGSDSAAWTRFWLAGVIPVARAGGTPDHAMSGFGRYISEAIFWTPAAVLPGPGITWDAMDENTARLTVEHNGMRQSVDIIVDPLGRPLRVVFDRWSNANDTKRYQFQPFGGTLSAYRDFGGFRVPTHVEAGNFFGTAEYFPFFIADVTSIRYID